MKVVFVLLYTAYPVVWVAALSASGVELSTIGEPRLEQQEKIEELMQKAFEADDPAEEKEYYSEILRLNPSDQTAYERLKEVEARLEQHEQRKPEKGTPSRQEISAPVTREKLDLKQKTEQQVIDIAFAALSYDNLEQLRGAKKEIEALLQINPNNGSLQNIEASLKERISSKENLVILRSILLALLAVSALYVLCFFLLRKKRAFLQAVDDPKQVFVIDKDRVSLGALEGENDLVIHDERRRVSRHHCQISRSGNRFYICDTSANGTRINGRSIEKQHPVKLEAGDQISLAGAVAFSFRLK